MSRKKGFLHLLDIMLTKHADGRSVREISDYISSSGLGDPDGGPDERTIRRYINQFVRLDDQVKLLDAPFAWSRCEEYGLPWEAGAYIVGLCRRWLQGEVFFFHDEKMKLPIPTARHMRWAWRLHVVEPEMEDVDVWCIALQYSVRELIKVVFDEAQDFNDLDNALLFQPWQSPLKMSAYRRLMEHHNQGEKIELLMIRLLDVPGFSSEVKDAIGRSALMPALLDSLLPRDFEHLPSGVLSELRIALDRVEGR
jgi:hypothetical protein